MMNPKPQSRNEVSMATSDERNAELDRLYSKPLTDESAKRITELIRQQIDENGLTVHTLHADGTWTDDSLPPLNER
jgi:hypothetical protein